MADSQLNTTTNSGSQTNTQSPQSVGATNSTTAPSSNVQPGTASNLLVSQNGVSLHPTALPTVNLSAGTTTSTAAPIANRHHFNFVLTGLSVLLFAIAIWLFWSSSHSVKTTTE